MSLTDGYSQILYEIATIRNGLKILMTPAGILIRLGLQWIMHIMAI